MHELLALLEAPRYIPADVARFTGLTSQRVMRWLQGYTRTPHTAKRKGVPRQLPAMMPALVKRHPHHVSFLDLLDLKFVKACLDAGAGLSVRKICERLAKAREIFGERGQLYTKKEYFITWKRIYIDLDGHLEQLPDRQQAFDEVITPIAKPLAFDQSNPFIASASEMSREIEFDPQTKLAYKWFPKSGERHVVIDPQMAFGAPVVNGTRIKTNVLADYVLVANYNIDDIARDMQLQPKQVKAAVQFEQALAA